MLDKRNILRSPGGSGPLHLEIGCGPAKKNPDAIGIDAMDFECVDIVGDVFEVLEAFPDGSVDSISSFHFFEHSDMDRLMLEMGRIIREDGALRVVVPHFSNPYFYSDPTHKRQFGLYTFCYLVRSDIFSRQVPNYGVELPFDLLRVDLVFKSSPPFYARHAFKKIAGLVFNSCTYMREFYEENLCHLIACYEIDYRMIKRSKRG